MNNKEVLANIYEGKANLIMTYFAWGIGYYKNVCIHGSCSLPLLPSSAPAQLGADWY